MSQEFITLKQVSQLLQASERWIKRLVKENKIPSYKISGKRLFDRKEVIEWVKTHKEGR